MAEKHNQPAFIYPIIILSGVIGAVATFLDNLKTIYSALGLAISLILIGVGVLGWFVTQRKISLGDAVQYSIIWTLLILLAGTGGYLIISQPVTITGSLLDNNAARNPVSGYEVTLYHHQTGITSNVRTDAQGNFIFANVQDGEYDIIIDDIVVRSEEASKGLQKLVQGDIRAGRFYLDSLSIQQQSADTSLAITTAEVIPTLTPIPTATPDPLVSALDRAHDFDGRNSDWEPFVLEFVGVPMVLVPKGCFMMGSISGQEWEAPVHEVCFEQPYWIDEYEVTNQQYAQFGGKTPRNVSTTTGNYPINNISWLEAKEYCHLRETRLPTEAEWEYAARGPDNLVYPWGNEFDSGNVNFCDRNCDKNWKDMNFDDGYASVAPVGTFPGGASWVRAYDMSGNLWEWVSTIIKEYPYTTNDGRESTDNRTSRRAFRGGSWATLSVFTPDFIFDVRSSVRDNDSPFFANDELGIRCARDV